MRMERLLRLDPARRVAVFQYTEGDDVVGWNDDGSPIIEKGTIFTTWGWDSGYAVWRRRFWRLCLRMRRR